MAVYSVCFCLPALTWTILAHTIRRRTHIPPAASFGKQAVSTALNVGAVFTAFASPWLALAMIAAVAVLWLVPPRRIVEKTRALQIAAARREAQPGAGSSTRRANPS